MFQFLWRHSIYWYTLYVRTLYDRIDQKIKLTLRYSRRAHFYGIVLRWAANSRCALKTILNMWSDPIRSGKIWIRSKISEDPNRIRKSDWPSSGFISDSDIGYPRNSIVNTGIVSEQVRVGYKVFKFGEISYYLTQFLNEHGNYMSYLKKKCIETHNKCPYCEKTDKPEHTAL